MTRPVRRMASLTPAIPSRPTQPDEPAPAPFVPPPARPEPAEPAPTAEQAAAVAAPAFLAGRSSRPPTTPAKEDIVPSWDVDGRYGAAAPPPQSKGGDANRLDGVLTAIAVIAILALGVAAVIFLPGLLNKGAGVQDPAPVDPYPVRFGHQRAERSVQCAAQCSAVDRPQLRPDRATFVGSTEQPAPLSDQVG